MHLSNQVGSPEFGPLMVAGAECVPQNALRRCCLRPLAVRRDSEHIGAGCLDNYAVHVVQMRAEAKERRRTRAGSDVAARKRTDFSRRTGSAPKVCARGRGRAR
jgi:hypothetical protein